MRNLRDRLFYNKTKLSTWLEVTLITVTIPGIRFLMEFEDPFFIQADFTWTVLAPLLVGLRYGFVPGVIAGITVIAWASVYGQWQIPVVNLPMFYSMGILLTGAIAGEFADHWRRRLHTSQTECQYLHERFDKFTRNYQLLKASHAKLEQKLSAGTISLRTAMMSVREQIVKAQNGENSWPMMGECVLDIFAEYGGVQMAAVYPVSSDNILSSDPVASLGRPSTVSVHNVLMAKALKTGKTVIIKPDRESESEGVLAIVPLVDIHGRIWAVVSVHSMPFLDFNYITYDLLTVLAGHLGDATGFSQRGSTDEQWFKQALQRQFIDLRRYDIPATVVTLTLNPTLFSDVLLLIKCQIRGIDYLWDKPNNSEMKTICILLPLTGSIKAIEFVKRIDELMQQQYGVDVIDNSVHCETFELNGKSSADELIGSLGK